MMVNIRPCAETAAATLEVNSWWREYRVDRARTQVVQRDGIVVEVACGEFFLDARLAFEQPVQRCVQIVLIGLVDPEQGRQGGDVPPTGGGELTVGLEQASSNHRHDPLALG